MNGPAPVFDWAACGTDKQYRKHLRHGITPCEPCRQAESRRVVDVRVKHGATILASRRRWYAENRDEINRRRREWKAGR